MWGPMSCVMIRAISFFDEGPSAIGPLIPTEVCHVFLTNIAMANYILTFIYILMLPRSYIHLTHCFSQIFIQFFLPHPVVPRSQDFAHRVQISPNPVSFQFIHLPSIYALRHKLLRAMPPHSIISLERPLLSLTYLASIPTEWTMRRDPPAPCQPSTAVRCACMCRVSPKTTVAFVVSTCRWVVEQGPYVLSISLMLWPHHTKSSSMFFFGIGNTLYSASHSPGPTYICEFFVSSSPIGSMAFFIGINP